MNPTRLLALVVAWPLFQSNMDSTMLATALPTMAQALGLPVLHLNLAITCYLLGLSLCLPLSGWAADRWGPRAVFLFAVGLFSVAATLCGFAPDLWTLVALRLAQGVAGALMLPASRMLLLRHVSAGDMVEAMVWFTVPGSIARMLGPMAGGALVTWFGWNGVFLIHLPIGALGLLMLWRHLPADEALTAPGEASAFDGRGFLMLALGLSSFTALVEVGMKGLLTLPAMGALAALGLAPLLLYGHHALRVSAPLVDLRVLRHRTFFIANIGAIPLRIAVGAFPFLLPLLMQAGFGFTPMQSGLITMAGALGSLGSRGLLQRILARVNIRKFLLGASAAGAACCLGYGFLRADTPVAAMFVLILLGGMCTALSMVTLSSLGFSGIEREQASHAATTATMVQQLSLMFGVTLGAGLLSLSSLWHHGPGAPLAAADFPPVFAAIAALIASTLFTFRPLRADDGHELRGRRGPAKAD